MNIYSKPLIPGLFIVLAVLFSSGYAAAHDGGGSPFTGKVNCGAYFTTNLNYRFRINLLNRNEYGDIRIERIRVYFKDGSLAYDSNVLGYLPPGAHGILSPTNNVLKPHQSEKYRSEQVFGYNPGQIEPTQQGNIQIVINWSSNANENPLSVGASLNIYDPVLSIFPIARSAGKCVAIQ